MRSKRKRFRPQDRNPLQGQRCVAPLKAVDEEPAAAASAAAQVTAELDYSFQNEHSIPIETFWKDWQGYGKAVREFSFDPDLPEEKLIRSGKTVKNALLGLVVAALLQLSSTIDENTQTEKVTKSRRGRGRRR